MRRALRAVWRTASSRFLTPVVVGSFLLMYITVAFQTEDALIALIDFTARSRALILLFALIPLNSALLLVKETLRYRALRRALALDAVAAEGASLQFDETVTLQSSTPLPELAGRLAPLGYRTRQANGGVAAWRGISLFPARVLFLLGTLTFFSGILFSVGGRTSFRGAVIEGEPFPSKTGEPAGIVQLIDLEHSTRPFMDKSLVMVVSSEDGSKTERFGLYPPALSQGAFVYPRYLGVALFYRFFAPDLKKPYEAHSMLSIYPPGKETTEAIAGTPYRLVISLVKPDDGSDPYITGRFSFLFKVLNGKEVLCAGSAPSGGVFVNNGYRLEFPVSRRLVMTDFIEDYGVYLIWASALFFLLACAVWAPIRLWFPRREMLFVQRAAGLESSSRAEGGRRSHAGIFHEALDVLGGSHSAGH